MPTRLPCFAPQRTYSASTILALLKALLLLSSFVLTMLFCFPSEAHAQTADRIAQDADLTRMQTLANHHPAWASTANDAGAVPAGLALENMTLVLARSPEQEQAFEQFLKDQQDPASPDYHHWLTPEEVGDRFGLSDHDLETVKSWLQSQGLHVNFVAPSRVFLGFGGTAADAGHAFQAEFHYYKVSGKQRISVASDPMIPAALAPVIRAVRGLFTIEDRPQHSTFPVQSPMPGTTFSNGTQTSHYIAPADFATIYDLPAGLTGAGITIGIVGESRTDMADFNLFKNLTGSSFANPTEVIPTAYGGVDPGPALTSPPTGNISTEAQGEATLDVDRTGSVAPGAQLLLVVSAVTNNGGGIDAATQYLVQSSPVPAQVISISWGGCESEAGASGVNYWDALFKQAVAEGISVFVASADAGASGCDTFFATPPANPSANSPNYICSSSYATCVGGTEFNDASNSSTYWRSTNSSTLGSALGYIPEGAWNDPLNSQNAPQAAASGGGVSAYIATPSWQTGTGVPSARSGRYTPDIAFSASAQHDAYFGCFAAGGGSCVTNNGTYYFSGFGGTSAAAPDMAGIAALLDQKEGSAQGSLNARIYAMAASAPSAFHDATVASSGVSSCSISTPSLCNNSIPGPNGLTGGQAGYPVQTGFDEVTGLGSLDVKVFIDDYSANTPTVTLKASSSSITSVQSLPVTVSVTGSSGNTTPTGSIVLSSGSYSSTATALNSGSATINIPSGSLAAGSDTLTATYTPDSSSSSVYTSATGTASVTVTKTTPTVTVSPAEASITSTEWLSVAVTVSGGSGAPVATGSVILKGGNYTSAAITLNSGTASAIDVAPGFFPVGANTLTATYTPDSAGSQIYNTATGSNTVTVTNAGPLSLTATPSTGVSYNQTVTLTATTTSTAAGGKWWITQDGTNFAQNGIELGVLPNGSNGELTVSSPPLSVGAHTFYAYYSATTPANNSIPSTGYAQVSLQVGKATPVITWPTPAPIVQGTALSSAQLDATANVAGSFVYSPASGTVLSGGTQTLSVTFTPNDTTNYNTAAASVSLTVNPAAPAVSLSPTSLTFAAENTGSTSTAQTVTLTNSGTVALSITSITATGDFAETNNCGTSVAASGNCTISVTFTPTTGGARTGTLTIADNAGGSPQTVALTGAGSTVSVTSSSNALSISSLGGSATASLQIAPDGGFSGTVNLTCAVTYQGSGTASDIPTCSLSPTQQQISGSGSATTTLTVNSTAPSGSAMLKDGWTHLGGAALAVLLFFGCVPRRRWRRWSTMAFLAIVITSATVGCGGGSSPSNNGGNTTPSNPGTTAGTYSVTVTANSGTVTATLSIPLSVQ